MIDNKKIYKYLSITSFIIVIALMANLIVPSFTLAQGESVTITRNEDSLEITAKIGALNVNKSMLYVIKSDNLDIPKTPQQMEVFASNHVNEIKGIITETEQTFTHNVQEPGKYYAVVLLIQDKEVEDIDGNKVTSSVYTSAMSASYVVKMDEEIQEEPKQEKIESEEPKEEEKQPENKVEELKKEENKTEEIKEEAKKEENKEAEKKIEETKQEDKKTETKPVEDKQEESKPVEQKTEENKQPENKEEKKDEVKSVEEIKTEPQKEQKDEPEIIEQIQKEYTFVPFDDKINQLQLDSTETVNIQLQNAIDAGKNDDYIELEDVVKKAPEQANQQESEQNENKIKAILNKQVNAQEEAKSVEEQPKEQTKLEQIKAESKQKDSKTENNKSMETLSRTLNELSQSDNRSPEKLPQTGNDQSFVIFAIIVFSLISVGSFIKYRKA